METGKTVIVVSMFGRVDSVYGSTQAMRDDGPEFLAPIAKLVDDGADSGWHPSRGNDVTFRVMRIR